MKTDDLCVLDAFQPTLTGMWREACRHIEISESAATIAKLLAEHMPIGQLLVRRVDRNRSCVETVAVGLPAPDGLAARRPLAMLGSGDRGGRPVVPAGRGCPSRQAGVGGHALGGSRAHGCPGRPSARAACRLRWSGGALVITAADDAQFDSQHIELMALLLEPFSTALENDRRLREMAAMRAAAEAEKHSLLSRLGRKEIGNDTVVGLDSGLRGVFERVGLVAKSDAPVLILGETGTGKELIARMIHNRSPRAAGPFMRVNCGAIPSELIDSQLFGHERGAFTGAVETRPGWFERRRRHALLDEVGELPLAAQVRLLRILQDGWLEKVGGQESIHVDVRIVAATHRDLAAMVNAGKFREDLWYRIAVFPIILPPLRERTGDISELARHFAERAAARFVLPRALPTPADIEFLTSYAWPGNIRELAAVIDRAAILGDGKRLEVSKALGVTANLPSAVPTGGASAGEICELQSDRDA